MINQRSQAVLKYESNIYKGKKGADLLYDIKYFIRFLHVYPFVTFVCHFNSTGSIQSCSHFGALNLCVLPGTHLQRSPVKHLRVKYLAQGHEIETM